METINKALHQPMPFTTGGQTITDRLTAAKHSLAGSQLGKTICKATTEELMAPKKKHLDYLLHCTNEPNVSIPSMANLLIERTQNPNWTVVYKALITIHNVMCYGNERFSQYLASCNTTFNLGSFLDKGTSQGYDMSQHVRKYGKYIGEKIATYRCCAFDFCKVKRGREDGLLRTMHTDKLLKTLPILQNQIDALLEFQVTSSELNNGVINCSFILLFRDLIRLFACYNDGVINLLEKYFDMNRKQCREALDIYKAFLMRLDKVAEFLRVAESVGIDRGEIPDLTRAPASLLEALEAHLCHLEGGKMPPANPFTAFSQQSATPQATTARQAMSDIERQRYLEYEKEKLRQFEEERKRGAAGPTNPFESSSSSAPQPSDDLVDLFNTAPTALDPTNPFASFGAVPPMALYNTTGYGMAVPPQTSSFGDFNRAFGSNRQGPSRDQGSVPPAETFNPFLSGGAQPGWGEAPPAQPGWGEAPGVPAQQWPAAPVETPVANPFASANLDGSYTRPSPIPPSEEKPADIDQALSSLTENLNIAGGGAKWVPPGGAPVRPPAPMAYGANPYAPQVYPQFYQSQQGMYPAPGYQIPGYGVPTTAPMGLPPMTTQPFSGAQMAPMAAPPMNNQSFPPLSSQQSDDPFR